MRGLVVFIVLVLFGNTAIGQQDSGFTDKAEAKNLLVNGLKEGKWVEYENERGITNETSAIFYMLTIYKTGKPFGIVREYFISGTLEHETPYKNGKINGIQKWYYQSGKLKEEDTFIKGKENGVLKTYYESGKLESELPFKNGGMIGGGKSYYESGKIESVDKDTTINRNIYITEKSYYEDGKLKSKTLWYNPAEGDTIYYDSTGNEIK